MLRRGTLVRQRFSRGLSYGASSGGGGLLAPDILLMSPANDNTISLTDGGTEGVSVSFTRATTATVFDYQGVLQTMASGVPRMEGARWTGSAWSTVDGSGNPLRPSRTVTVGGYSWDRFDTYAPHQTTTAYSLGDRIAVTIGGLGYYAECSTAGTSGGTEPTWSVATGISDGTAEWDITATSYYRLKGLLVESSSVNSLLQSRDFSTTWTNGGTPTEAQDQVGIDGTSVAWTLGDDNASAQESKLQNVTVSDDSNTHVVSLYVAKDSDESRMMGLRFRLIGGTTQRITLHMNTKTGATAVESSVGTVGSGVIDEGGWWRVWVSVANNSTGNTTAEVTVYPAAGTVLGTSSSAATGTIVADAAQLEQNKSYPSSFIETTTVAVTRNAESVSFSEPSWFDTAGTVVVGVSAVNIANNTRVIANGQQVMSHVTSGGGRLASLDGSAFAFSANDAWSSSSGDEVRLGLIWGSSARTASVNGTNGTGSTYDGDWNGATVYIGSTGSAAFLNGTLLNLTILRSDIGSTDLAAITARDAA